jgi:hypothetical protein
VVLEVDTRDSGCGVARAVLERYVETELGAQAARGEFAAVYLAMCRACRTEHDGLVALIEHDTRCRTPPRPRYASFADFTDPDGNRWVLQERGFRDQPGSAGA